MAIDLGTINYSVIVDTSDMDRADEITARYTETLRTSRGAVDRLQLSQSRLSRATDGVTTRYEQLRAQIDPTYAAQQRFTKGLQVLDAELKQGNISLSRYTADVAALRANTMGLNRGTRSSTGAIGGMRGAMQQAGYQVGDFAVQVGAGQNALVAFSQQGAQMAGIFGPAGAVIGALIAVGGAIAGGLVRSMGEGTESATSLIDKTKDLTKELNNATEAQARYVRGNFAQENNRQKDIIAEQSRELEMLNARMERFIEDNEAVGVPLDRIKNSEAYKSLEQQALEAQVRIDNAKDSITENDKELEKYEETIKGTGEEEERREEKLRSLVQTAKEQADTIRMNARETAIYKANLQGAGEEERAAINRAYDRIEAFEREEEARRALMRSTQIGPDDDPFMQQMKASDRAEAIIQGMRAEANAVESGLDKQLAIEQQHERRVQALRDGYRTGAIESEERLNQLIVLSAKERNEQIENLEQQRMQFLTDSQQQTLTAVGNLFGNFADIAKEGGKEAFDEWKFFASAQAAVSTALAVANALATPPAPLGIALAGSIAALGAVQIAKIQNQEYQGARQYGGQTQPGGQYLVGEDGPEIIRMGGSPGFVTPNHKLGGGDISQNLVFQLPVDARKEAQRVVAESVPMIKNVAKQAVLEAAGQGSSMSRAMGRRR